MYRNVSLPCCASFTPPTFCYVMQLLLAAHLHHSAQDVVFRWVHTVLFYIMENHPNGSHSQQKTQPFLNTNTLFSLWSFIFVLTQPTFFFLSFFCFTKHPHKSLSFWLNEASAGAGHVRSWKGGRWRRRESVQEMRLFCCSAKAKGAGSQWWRT